jgi:N-methylhydantoinase A
VEITAIRIIGKGRFASFQLAGTSPANVAPAPYEWREVYFSCVNGGFHTPVYRGADLTPGHRLKGPLVIEESTTTVVVGPRDTVTIDSLGSFVIQLD